MPIYEYWCNPCKRRVSVLLLSSESSPRCPRCGGEQLTRLLSRFATAKSEDARLEALADPRALGDLDETDPRSMARWMKQMGQELGEDVGEDFDEMIEGAMEEEFGGGEGDGGTEEAPGV